jgi:hypothetical protein
MSGISSRGGRGCRAPARAATEVSWRAASHPSGGRDGAHPSWPFRPMPVTGPGVPGRPANYLDPVTTAHLPGHKTAEAIWASSTDAGSQ